MIKNVLIAVSPANEDVLGKHIADLLNHLPQAVINYDVINSVTIYCQSPKKDWCRLRPFDKDFNYLDVDLIVTDLNLNFDDFQAGYKFKTPDEIIATIDTSYLLLRDVRQKNPAIITVADVDDYPKLILDLSQSNGQLDDLKRGYYNNRTDEMLKEYERGLINEKVGSKMIS